MEPQGRFLFDGVEFESLSLEGMPVEELDAVLGRIAEFQVEEQRQFFSRTELCSLYTLSEEEYRSQQLWNLPDWLVVPAPRDEGDAITYVALDRQQVPGLFELREMLRLVRSAPAHVEREREQREEFSLRVLADFPDAYLVESGDHTMLMAFLPDGRQVAERRLSTVGNL